mmetsp:Transcript_19323/g.53466  ORF Transcript_19323/g.53466 Transcript_19323/m.53466 type:complete len:229 (-) Transcript_19323:242-928(-)
MLRRGTECLESAQVVLSSGATSASPDAPGTPGAAPPGPERASDGPQSAISMLPPCADLRGASVPALACASSAVTAPSGLLRSKPKRLLVAQSPGLCPLEFLACTSTPGTLSSSRRQPTLCFMEATWTGVLPSEFLAFGSSGSPRHAAQSSCTAAGSFLLAAKWSAVFRILLPVRACRLARPSIRRRMHSMLPWMAARCKGVRPSGPYRLTSSTTSESCSSPLSDSTSL